MEPLPNFLPPQHKAWLASAATVLLNDPRILGLTAGGSYVQGGMDEYSDLDLIVVVIDDARTTMIGGDSESYPHPASPADEAKDERVKLAASLGPMLCAFTAEHTGEKRMIICLYDSVALTGAEPGAALSPLHVDLKFVSLKEFESRVEEPVVLFDRHGDLARVMRAHPAVAPANPDPVWLEGRWWTWVHYTIEKAMRGELWEAVVSVNYLVERVLGPMAKRASGSEGMQAQGLRRLEQRASDWVEAFKATVPTYDRASCVRATLACAELYVELRAAQPHPVVGGSAAEHAVMAYVRRCAREVE